MNIDLGALGELEFTWWDVLWATISIAAGWIASVFAYRGVLAVMRRTPNVSGGLALFVARFTRYALIIFGVAVGIGFFGPSLQPLIAIVVIIAVIGVLVHGDGCRGRRRRSAPAGVGAPAVGRRRG